MILYSAPLITNLLNEQRAIMRPAKVLQLLSSVVAYHLADLGGGTVNDFVNLSLNFH